MALDFEEMRRIYRLEKSTARLVEVPDDFFTQLHGLVNEERTKYFDSLKDLNATRARDFGNLKKLIDEWFVVREKKLLNTVLVSAQLEEKDTSHLAAEEKIIFHSLYEVLRSHRGKTKSVLEANGDFVPVSTPPVERPPSALVPAEETRITPAPVEAPAYPSSHSESLPVRILSEIPSFVGTDLKEYGPYKAGQVVELPSKIAQLFISRKLGESTSA
jgi:DNA replication initiation complex subunit (GINS family)